MEFVYQSMEHRERFYNSEPELSDINRYAHPWEDHTQSGMRAPKCFIII